MRAHLFVLSAVLLALVLTAGPAAAARPSHGSAGGSALRNTASTLVIDRTVERPEKPKSRLWVGAVVGVFGVIGLVLSRAFVPAGRRERGPDGHPTA